MIDKAGHNSHTRILLAIREVYSSAYLIALNIISFVAYYTLTYLMITYSNLGIFLLSIPFELFILMILSASITLTIAIARINLARRRPSMLGAAGSLCSIALGSIALTCTCNVPIISTLLYLFGFNSLFVSSFLATMIQLQLYIIISLIVLNLASSLYMLNKIGSIVAMV